jgi:hypothetical protein
MFCNDPETIYFRYCRTFDGRLEPVDLARRNGRLVPRFHPSVLIPTERPDDPEQSGEYLDLLDEVCQNLTGLERQTWLKLLDQQPILEIARDAGVSRAAIYDRIRRMVNKNPYCAIWWRIKNKINQHA